MTVAQCPHCGAYEMRRGPGRFAHEAGCLGLAIDWIMYGDTYEIRRTTPQDARSATQRAEQYNDTPKPAERPTA